MQKNNAVLIGGTVVGSEFEKFTNPKGRKFYTCMIKADRTSGVSDYIPVVYAKDSVNGGEIEDGCVISVTGEYRSHNDLNRHKEQYVFAQNISVGVLIVSDSVKLVGTICKPVVLRKTPLGRVIADVLIAVNRPYGKSDYINCIAWNQNAVEIANLPVGTDIALIGRIQSREYEKNNETKVAYEVSINKFEKVEGVKVEKDSTEKA